MALTIINTQAAHNAYEQMTIDEQVAIDKAFTAARKALAENGIGQLANDDRAEELVAALAYYVIRSWS